VVTTRPGGFGRELFGDPLGGGGPISVVRALASAGQVVRVVFTEAPLHRSPAGAWDALDPSNYVFSVVSGQATAPTPVGVNPKIVVGPAWGVGNGSSPGVGDERGVDVSVDRQLIAGITYRVFVRNVRAAAGGLLGTPNAATFQGVTLLQETRLPERPQDLVDIANPPALGHWTIDAGGDVGVEDPADGVRKRVLRRWTTRKGAFRHLPRYGLGQALKGVSTVAARAALKADALGQVLEEPDIKEAQVDVAMEAATGVLTLTTRARTVRGLAFVASQKFREGDPIV
jgi:hypothetical protein